MSVIRYGGYHPTVQCIGGGLFRLFSSLAKKNNFFCESSSLPNKKKQKNFKKIFFYNIFCIFALKIGSFANLNGCTTEHELFRNIISPSLHLQKEDRACKKNGGRGNWELRG